MSPTEQFYKAICDKMSIERPWGELHPKEQHAFVYAVNVILAVVTNGEKNDS